MTLKFQCLSNAVYPKFQCYYWLGRGGIKSTSPRATRSTSLLTTLLVMRKGSWSAGFEVKTQAEKTVTSQASVSLLTRIHSWRPPGLGLGWAGVKVLRDTQASWGPSPDLPRGPHPTSRGPSPDLPGGPHPTSRGPAGHQSSVPPLPPRKRLLHRETTLPVGGGAAQGF